MTLDGYTDLPPGKIASVVTYLEMRQPPAPSDPAARDLSIRHVPQPDLDWYRKLYRAVGQDWLWFSRLRMNDDELTRIIHDPRVQVFALSLQREPSLDQASLNEASLNEDKGLLELDRRTPSEVEISYFGLTPDLLGRGAGQFLLAHALEAAWAHAPQRVWVHTCTLDHPKALSFYIKSGFTPYKRAIEISDDPRFSGNAPRSSASHVPLI